MKKTFNMKDHALPELQRAIILYKQDGYAEIGKPEVVLIGSRRFLSRTLIKQDGNVRTEMVVQGRVTKRRLNELIQQIMSFCFQRRGVRRNSMHDSKSGSARPVRSGHNRAAENKKRR